MFKKLHILTLLGFACMLHSQSIAASGTNYWFNGKSLSSCGQQAVKLLSNAHEDGLEDNRYSFGVSAVQQALAGQKSYANAATQLTNAMKKYVDDIRNGRFNPKLADKQLVMKPDPVNQGRIVSKGMASGRCDWMHQQAPPYIEYKMLKTLLRQYSSRETKDVWNQLPINAKYTVGTQSSDIAKIRTILTRYGDLASSQNNGSTYYDENLSKAVKSFQGRNGMLKDGEIGPVTLSALNSSTAQGRARQIIITMERWRWMPRNPGHRHIKVNIAGYNLQAVEGNRVIMRSPIIVGVEYRETPVFTAMMTGIKFNPSWNVPYNLAIQDKLPELKKNPSSLTRQNFVVSKRVGKSFKVVNPSSINWSRYSANNFPFKLRQRPGNNNALGKIRFTISSPFNIFLHSTPHQHLFKYAARNFSSGCIRVRDVVDLASFVFNNPGAWSRSRIEQSMQGTVTREVPLSHRIPVHITYFTVWIDERGVPHFMPDVYGQDQQVWQVMQRS